MSGRDLQSMLNELRDLANDGDAALFDDTQAIGWLNEGANHFCLETQILQYPQKITVVADVNEYALGNDEGDVFSVSHHDGSTTEPLDELDIDEIFFGARVTSTRPAGYYIRQNSAYLQSKNIADNTDVFTHIGPAYQYVLGVWPIPSAAGELTVWKSIEHPEMVDPGDLCLIPFRFQFAPVCFAVYKAKLKEQAHAEAEIYSNTFSALLDKGKERQINKGSAKPRRRRRRMEGTDEVDRYNRRWFD
jgi:hypothetical protein